MSSTSNSNTQPDLDSDLEHLTNFENLPFFSISHLNFFNFNTFQSAFLNLSVNPNILNSSSHNHTQEDNRRYRDVPSSDTSTSSLNTTITYSSLPSLEPNSDISENLDQGFIQEFTTLSLIEPLTYTSSREDPPDYKPTWNRDSTRQRIRILEREAIEVIAELRDLRDSEIARLSADIEEQIVAHLASYQDHIAYLRSTL